MKPCTPEAAAKSGICLYRSLSALLWRDQRLSLGEHRLFFLADGLRFPYRRSPAQTIGEENRKLLSTLFSRLGIAYHYQAGPVEELDKLLKPLRRGRSLLLYTHVDALPYDRSGALRGNAFHCIRVDRYEKGLLTFTDDFVPNPRGGYTTRTDTMEWRASRAYFTGLLWLEEGQGGKPQDAFSTVFFKNLKAFQSGGRQGKGYYGAAALSRLAQDVRQRRVWERTQRWYLELAAMLKYQWYAAFHYLILAAGELGLLTGPPADDLSGRQCFVCFP